MRHPLSRHTRLQIPWTPLLQRGRPRTLHPGRHGPHPRHTPTTPHPLHPGRSIPTRRSPTALHTGISHRRTRGRRSGAGLRHGRTSVELRVPAIWRLMRERHHLRGRLLAHAVCVLNCGLGAACGQLARWVRWGVRAVHVCAVHVCRVRVGQVGIISERLLVVPICLLHVIRMLLGLKASCCVHGVLPCLIRGL